MLLKWGVRSSRIYAKPLRLKSKTACSLHRSQSSRPFGLVLQRKVLTLERAEGRRAPPVLAGGEDERLRRAEGEGEGPGERDLAVGAGRLPDAVHHRVADRLEPVHGHKDQDVGAEKRQAQ